MNKPNADRPINRFIYLVFLIGLGFLWTGTAYIVQAYRLLNDLDGETVNLIVCGLYYLLQASGIAIVALLYRSRNPLAGGRLLPLISTLLIISSTSLAMLSNLLIVIISAGALMNLAIGVLSACYLTRLATDLPKKYRGLVFGSAYALGSIGSWLLSLPMNGKFLWNELSLLAIIVPAAFSLLLLLRLAPPQKTANISDPISFTFERRDFWLAGLLLFLLSAVNMIGFSFPLHNASESVYIEFTRAFYALGLVIAGLVSDKSRKWGAICCLASLAFPFAALALGGSMTGETVMWIFAYLFLGFFAVYRILLFSDIADSVGLPELAVLGLLAGRLGEAVGSLGHLLPKNPLILLAAFLFVLVILLFFVLHHRYYSTVISTDELEKRQCELYAVRCNFSVREKEIFQFILQGMSNSEIAKTLFITESTVKFHIGHILKKTGFSSRSELIADYKQLNR